jgi:hypothetical protein
MNTIYNTAIIWISENMVKVVRCERSKTQEDSKEFAREHRLCQCWNSDLMFRTGQRVHVQTFLSVSHPIFND